VMQNLVDSHDTDRLASMIVNGEGTKYSTDQEFDFNQHNNAASSQTYELRKPNERERNIQRLIVLLQMTYLGAPMIYYGDEAGMWGGGDPDDRMPMIWADKEYQPQAGDPRGRERKPDEMKFDEELFNFYKQAIALRRQYEALNHGEFRFLATDDAQHAVVFARESKNETLIVALNRGDQDARINTHHASDSFTPIFVTRGEITSVKAEPTPDGVDLVLPPLTGAVFRAD